MSYTVNQSDTYSNQALVNQVKEVVGEAFSDEVIANTLEASKYDVETALLFLVSMNE